MSSKTYYRSPGPNGRVYVDFTPHNAEADGWVKLTQKEGAQAVKDDARKDLREMLKPGDTVYSTVTEVSRSGMSRKIKFYVPQTELRTVDTINNADGTYMSKKKRVQVIRDLTWLIGRAIDYRVNDDHELIVGGCGMDMCFHVVYSLGRALWPKGTKKPHGSRNGSPDSDGGYALKSSHL